MPDLLLELFSEEIPARMQPKAADDLRRLVTDGLVARGLTYAHAAAFATPRRLTLAVEGLADASLPVREERKGPRTDAPAAALEGFLRSTGLTRDQLEERDDEQGPRLLRRHHPPGPPRRRDRRRDRRGDGPRLPLAEVDALGQRPAALGPPAPLDPLHPDPRVRHRRSCPSRSTASPPATPPAATASTPPSPSPSPPSTTTAPSSPAPTSSSTPPSAPPRSPTTPPKPPSPAASTLVDDPALLAENAGLTEWPVTLLGDIDPRFLDLPPEVLQTSMRANQKFFSLKDASGRITAYALVANRDTADDGATIRAGNARVLTARLADAEFFWQNDLRTPLDAMAAKLATVTFHNKLGTQADRIARIAALARELAPAVGADPDLAERAAKLAKADLASQMVYEFPELQGTMGRAYALARRRRPRRRRRRRGALRPSRPLRRRSDRAGFDRRGARRQARHAGRLLGDRREADRLEGSVRASARGAWA